MSTYCILMSVQCRLFLCFSAVPCPVCGKLVSKTFINSHLDTCLNRCAVPTTLSVPTSFPVGTKPKISHKKLPNLVFPLIKDRDLRKKLKIYSLSTQGLRHVLIDRLKEFILCYNAQCDSINPKTSECV